MSTIQVRSTHHLSPSSCQSLIACAFSEGLNNRKKILCYHERKFVRRNRKIGNPEIADATPFLQSEASADRLRNGVKALFGRLFLLRKKVAYHLFKLDQHTTFLHHITDGNTDLLHRSDTFGFQHIFHFHGFKCQ